MRRSLAGFPAMRHESWNTRELYEALTERGVGPRATTAATTRDDEILAGHPPRNTAPSR